MDKRKLSETEICDRYITPALEQAGWQKAQIRREYTLTEGRIIVRGKLVARGRRKRADYVLFSQPNQPLAVIEAKDNKHSLGAGIQQALGYAELLDVPFVFSSNGDGFLLHDRSGTYAKTEQEIALDGFPSPDELWERYKRWRQLENAPETLLASRYYPATEGKEPRYYQQLAVNRTIEAIAKGQKRCLLVMATGTGKTFTVFNIIWRLWKTGTAKRVLFLADRNALVDQTKTNDFQPFGGAMQKLTRKLVDEKGRIDSSYEIYLALYQALVGDEEREDIYSKFDRDFFDLVVIDECHRGSAAEDSTWRQVLDYFHSAIQIGLTATPRETEYISNIDYFGEPIYTYSLRQGIEDGFLAPFKVVQVNLDIDLEGWTPDAGETDDYGQLIEERDYNVRDFDRAIKFPQRTQEVAAYITEFIHDGDPMRKTIIFCENIDHAEAMRQALMNVPANRPFVQRDRRYIMRITGDETEGKAQLDNFINPKEAYPVMVTTSKLMTTGVDAQTCHVIVLDRRIQSLTEFKQIIGRGTRLRTDYNKHYFTIIDFRNATHNFEDPDWDGPPIQDENYSQTYRTGNTDEEISEVLEGEEASVNPQQKYVVGKQRFSVARERTSYYDTSGELVTESLRDYTRRTVNETYQSLDEFLKRWQDSDRKQAVIEELQQQGVFLEALQDMVGQDYDPFDLICHIAFDQPPLTRRERAEKVRKQDVFSKYGEKARAVLDALLEKYADQNVIPVGDTKVLKLNPFTEIGTPVEIVKTFGGKKQYQEAVRELQQLLYDDESA
ncbi:UNVERIFIED_CONTAM: restriction endonuclease [Euhalothece sp. KZN 001]